jgi:hypothetical protein
MALNGTFILPEEQVMRLVQQTNLNIFLTGKAGTGKTTLLRKICSTTWKRFAIVAPTGVAAIHAGGSTIHSFFNIFPHTFLPYGEIPHSRSGRYETAWTLSRNIKLKNERIKIIQNLDLLIVDEVSMVRCDLLDALDVVLRKYRHSNLPFGGLQLLLCGDLYQLPPVVKDSEANYLLRHYPSFYFFESKALKQAGYVPVELKTVHRQTDPEFLAILNQVRDGHLSQQAAARLHERFNLKLAENPPEGYITLTSHVGQADRINQERLERLPGKKKTFKAHIDGDFPAGMYPADEVLELKLGAQVMFVKNNRELNFFNGKIGWVEAFDAESGTICIRCEEDEMIDVPQEVWEHQEYGFDQQKNALTKDTVGRFFQFPLKLAWAITIHKGQGLTFERAVIDAGKSFASGQVYVALSRCRTLEGLVLRSRIDQGEQLTDDLVCRYYDTFPRESEVDAHLTQALNAFPQSLLNDAFLLKDVANLLYPLRELLRTGAQTAGIDTEQIEKVYSEIERLIAIGQKYLPAAHAFCLQPDADGMERFYNAVRYFREHLTHSIVQPLVNALLELDGKDKSKVLHKKLRGVLPEIPSLYRALAVSEAFIKCRSNQNFDAMPGLLETIEAESKAVVVDMLKKTESVQASGKKEHPGMKYMRARKEKKPKGASTLETLALLREGNHPGTIAELRNLAASTIWGHLRSAIKQGKMEPNEIIDETALNEVKQFLDAHTECTQFGQLLKIAEQEDIDANHVGLLWALRERELIEAEKP